MHEKGVKIGKCRYRYYIKIKGKVKNICLGRDEEKARNKVKRIMRERKMKKRDSVITGHYWRQGFSTSR